MRGVFFLKKIFGKCSQKKYFGLNVLKKVKFRATSKIKIFSTKFNGSVFAYGVFILPTNFKEN